MFIGSFQYILHHLILFKITHIKLSEKTATVQQLVVIDLDEVNGSSEGELYAMGTVDNTNTNNNIDKTSPVAKMMPCTYSLYFFSDEAKPSGSADIQAAGTKPTLIVSHQCCCDIILLIYKIYTKLSDYCDGNFHTKQC